MPGRRSARALLGAALCAAAILAGCSGQRDTSEGRRIEAVVKRFALAHGPEACGLLTSEAVVKLYGGKSDSPRGAKAACVSRSRGFRGRAVDVTFVKIRTSTAGSATARTLDHKHYYSVSLAKRHGRWLIDGIAPQQAPA